MTVLDTVRRRYTAKHYDAAKRVSDTDFTELLEVLRLSPTSVNAQATKFFIADTPEAKAKIAPAFWDFNQPRVTDASHVVVFAVPTVVTDEHLKAVLQKEDADGRFPTEELKNQQDAGRRRCVELFSETPGGTFAWVSRQAYIAMGFLLFAAAEKALIPPRWKVSVPKNSTKSWDLPTRDFEASVPSASVTVPTTTATPPAPSRGLPPIRSLPDFKERRHAHRRPYP